MTVYQLVYSRTAINICVPDSVTLQINISFIIDKHLHELIVNFRKGKFLLTKVFGQGTLGTVVVICLTKIIIIIIIIIINNNNNNRTETRNWRCFTISSLRCELVSNTYAQVPMAQLCANHVQHIRHLSRTTCCVPYGTKGQLSY